MFLATVTPASGYIGVPGGLILGLTGGVVCYIAAALLKGRIKVDDSLDVFAVHGVGGIVGTLLAAVFGAAMLGGGGLAEGVTMGSQFNVQVIGVIATVLWSLVFTFIIVKVTTALVGLRVDDEEITQGLDVSAHGESGYSL